MKDFFLLTSNLGSLFGGNHSFSEVWLDLIVEAITREDAKFVALHLQEAGGKHADRYVNSLSNLILILFQRLNHLKYTHCRAFLDLDSDCIEEYTALASVMFIHDSLLAEGVEQYNFKTNKYSQLKRMISDAQPQILLEDNLFECSFVRKKKFPHSFWREIRWSRKGFLHTRWKLKNNRIVDLINIHLFHDDCNITAIENPMKYRNIRSRALRHTLDSFNEWGKTNGIDSHTFIFGDLNFRLNVPALVKKLTGGVEPKVSSLDSSVSQLGSGLKNRGSNVGSGSDGDETSSNCASSPSNLDLLAAEQANKDNAKSASNQNIKAVCLEYWNDCTDEDCNGADKRAGTSNREKRLIVARKIFEYYRADDFIADFTSYREFDDELIPFNRELFEFPVKFVQTYPWSEDPKNWNSFLKTRPPAWCDRVFMNKTAWRDCAKSDVVYDALGKSTCTGDHKPVGLSFSFSK